ncbi:MULTISPECIES: amino acid ABC transporter ATP-binding protein [unclassified Mesorhizobium]|uniref:amino acid ABC transporter ATP-binding protein n=3 Tax=Mesorhizobium TaxID=68287 RepID=UPI0023DE765D|nr:MULTISPECIES: amino acid ABC transporter ATP-binding protein [unclassified Mesorhizobium]MDF3169920.1 amino acid ABC transporter ATP-binding protein [Mesorhizobium sp. P16.1]MDF3179844.1 amino acid ABC transporter ATP-binding protein [Mesorhizobium sp. P17.1]MDF3186834.1 amino acid ABC transporter ATP-binding protein [Mesorhizobium sp. ICCV3110.1]
MNVTDSKGYRTVSRRSAIDGAVTDESGSDGHSRLTLNELAQTMDSRGQPHVEKVRSEWNRRRRDTAPVLKVHELSKNFGAVRILNDVTFQMAEGEVISLIGASGSGKSTLLRCINFLETPTSGRIEVMGDAISITTNRPGKSEITNRAKIRLFRQRTGMVFQNFNLWPHRTVIGNVTEALVYVLGKGRREAEDMALSALSKVGMAEFRDRYPSQLSGGQQQRVAIARVLAMRPKIMLFDEPTSALDPELVGEVLKVIRTLAEEGATILLVTHEMRFARDVSSRMIFLRKGILEQDDAPEELFRNPASEAVKRFLSSVMPAAA